MNQLTVAIATYRDSDALWFVLEALREYHGNHFDILILDNAPERCSKAESVTKAVGGRYIHRPDLDGTSRSRDACFRLAKTPWVMVCDSHVLFAPGAIDKLIELSKKPEHANDFFTGPLVWDDGRGRSDLWKSTTPPGLWGVWESDPRGAGTEPFDIPMQGLGCFAMSKEAWPGFNLLARGFGGEEGYIHEKVRKRGGRVLCIPQLRWRHKFRDVGGWNNNVIPYSASLNDHTFNLLVEHRELGMGAEAEAAILKDFGSRLGSLAEFEKLHKESRMQPSGEEFKIPKQKILGLWYTDNTVPQSLMQKSLESIYASYQQTWRHAVSLIAVGWERPVNLPPAFHFIQFTGEKKRGHGNIIKQIREGIEVINTGFEIAENGSLVPMEMHAICFMEHDVIYPQGYFQKIADTFALYPNTPVVSNLDYIGMNENGWQPVKERHEPMHQLSMRWDVAVNNVERAAKEQRESKDGSCLLEPQEFICVSKGLLGYDMDHTMFPKGVTPLSGRKYVVITGRPDHDKNRTMGELKNLGIYDRCVAIYTRDTNRHADTDAGIAAHKSESILKAGVVEFWEDNPSQVIMIRQNCPNVVVHHVVNGKVDPRSNWVRLQPVDGLKNYAGRTNVHVLGLAPSVHVNHKGVNGQTRISSHGEVCYGDAIATEHPHYGDYKKYWPMENSKTTPPKAAGGGCGCKGGTPAQPAKPTKESLEKWFQEAKDTNSDFHEHVDTLKEYASRCNHATQIGMWGKPSRAAIATGVKATDGTFVDYAPATRPEWIDLQNLMGDRFKGKVWSENSISEIEDTDLLFLDLQHTGKDVYNILTKYKNNIHKYIVIHTTEIFGETSDTGMEKGVLHGIRKFIGENKQWTVVRHDHNNYGLMVLSCLADDRKDAPNIFRQGINFAKAVVKHAADGARAVTPEVHNQRVELCLLCPERCYDSCSLCGCNINNKAAWAEQKCPANPPKWEAV